MAGRRPGPGQKQPPAKSMPGEEEPSAVAELHVFKIPAGDSPAIAGNPAGRFLSWMRSARLGIQIRMVVPPANAAEMISLFRNVGLAVTWAVTVLVTLAIVIPVGLPVAAVVAIVMIELAGFVIGALSVRRRSR
jgi:hypothetical protein